MKWKKLGLVIKPDPSVWWRQTHCMIPTPEHVEGNIYKIYFSGRNTSNQSHIGYARIDITNPSVVLDYSTEPVLCPGDLGAFDDNGVTPSCIIKDGRTTLMFYIGWNPGSTTRMHIFGGLALSDNNGETFKRYSRAPIIERNIVNPFINTAPFVVRNDDQWVMYYVSGVEWVHKDLPRYNIQIATSRDGKNWNREGKVAIDFEGDENALARPFVMKEDGIWRMYFAAKGSEHPFYKLYLAESPDGFTWKRVKNAFSFEGAADYDSEMMEYAAVVKHGGKKIMFYNGNNYGFDGILCAEEIV